MQLLDWDRKAAESSFLHAIDSNPRYALAHTWVYKSYAGRDSNPRLCKRTGQWLGRQKRTQTGSKRRENGGENGAAKAAQSRSLLLRRRHTQFTKEPPLVGVASCHVGRGDAALLPYCSNCSS